jgi:16S rRNA (guanine527-N7)-methyltransferase
MVAEEHLEVVLRGLAARYGLTEAQCRQMSALLGLLESDDHAPSSVRLAAQAVDVHLADSLVALELEVVRSARVIADLGSGAGFPGLALAAALPASEVRLIESQVRKCTFIEAAITTTGLQNARVIRARAEEWVEGSRQHDLLLARALAPQPVVLEYAAPLLRVGGSLVDWRGRRDEADEVAALRAATQLGLRRVEVRRVEPFTGAREHHLHVFTKDEATPARFPRRAGIARKRPLGA